MQGTYAAKTGCTKCDKLTRVVNGFAAITNKIDFVLCNDVLINLLKQSNI